NELNISTADGSPALIKPDGTPFDFTSIAQEVIGNPEYQTFFVHGCMRQKHYPTDRIDLQIKECYLYTRATERFRLRPEVGSAFKKMIAESDQSGGVTTVEFDQNAGYLTLGGRVLLSETIGLAAHLEGIIAYRPFGGNRNKVRVAIVDLKFEVPLLK
ncbi:MAG: hypothetical protein Q7S00_06630, partial [bacterium]|nr:hypothetical protein [bacterium]